MFESLNISDWEVFQQKNGKADIEIFLKLNEESWLKKPNLEAERKFSEIFSGVKIRCVEETTGEALCDWVKSDRNSDVFKCVLKDIPVGGPYQLQKKLVFFDGNTETEWWATSVADHIGVGDIFLIAGQSNAQGTATGPYYEKPDMNVRSYSKGKWNVATQPLGGNGCHSMFLSYGKILSQKLGYPVGLISRAVGGSPVTTWVDGGVYAERIKKEKIKGIKAILWYQGCEEAAINAYENYEELFMSFAETMRTHFCDDTLPIITFQLNKRLSEEPNGEKGELGYENIRNVQREIAQKHDNIYVIPTVDMRNLSDHIHNSVSSNSELAYRCVKYALDCIYGKKKYRAPEFEKSEKTSKNSFTLQFKNVEKSLFASYVLAKNLPIMVEDETGKNDIEKYEIHNNVISIFTKRNIKGKAYVKIHYGVNPQFVIVDTDTKLPIISQKNILIQ